MRREREIKRAIRERDHDLCRCCGWREAESVHELKPKGMGGSQTAVSFKNSIAVCGDGVRGCHGFLQRHEITFRFDRHRSADYWIAFRARTTAAADYMGIWRENERASDPHTFVTEQAAEAKRRIQPARTPIERMIDEACGIITR